MTGAELMGTIIKEMNAVMKRRQSKVMYLTILISF